MTYVYLYSDLMIEADLHREWLARQSADYGEDYSLYYANMR